MCERAKVLTSDHGETLRVSRCAEVGARLRGEGEARRVGDEQNSPSKRAHNDQITTTFGGLCSRRISEVT